MSDSNAEQAQIAGAIIPIKIGTIDAKRESIDSDHSWDKGPRTYFNLLSLQSIL